MKEQLKKLVERIFYILIKPYLSVCFSCVTRNWRGVKRLRSSFLSNSTFGFCGPCRKRSILAAFADDNVGLDAETGIVDVIGTSLVDILVFVMNKKKKKRKE